MWRVGRKVPINVYDGDRPVCQCHNQEDAALIADALNCVRNSTALLNAAIRAVRHLDESGMYTPSVDIWAEQVKVQMALLSGAPDPYNRMESNI